MKTIEIDDVEVAIICDLLASGVKDLLLDMHESNYEYYASDVKHLMVKLGMEEEIGEIDWDAAMEEEKGPIDGEKFMKEVCHGDCNRTVMEMTPPERLIFAIYGRCPVCQGKYFPESPNDKK